jgi:hypothetical protein
MSDHDTLVAALRAWNDTQNADWRAAGELVIDHGHWLRDPAFRERCIGDDDGTVYIDWDVVTGMLHRRELTGTGSQRAILRWATFIVRDMLGAESLDRINCEAVASAVCAALGVKR